MDVATDSVLLPPFLRVSFPADSASCGDTVSPISTAAKSRLHIKPLEVYGSKPLEQRIRDKIKKNLSKLLSNPNDNQLRTAVLKIVYSVVARHPDLALKDKTSTFEKRLLEYRCLRKQLQKYNNSLAMEGVAGYLQDNSVECGEDEGESVTTKTSSSPTPQLNRKELCQSLATYLDQLKETTAQHYKLAPDQVQKFYQVLGALQPSNTPAPESATPVSPSSAPSPQNSSASSTVQNERKASTPAPSPPVTTPSAMGSKSTATATAHLRTNFDCSYPAMNPRYYPLHAHQMPSYQYPYTKDPEGVKLPPLSSMWSPSITPLRNSQQFLNSHYSVMW